MAGTALLSALAALVLLVALVTWRQVNGFIALLLAALAAGLGAGLGPLAVLRQFQEGLGATLGGVAGMIALGAMLGRLLAATGGAEVLAERLAGLCGPRRAVLVAALLGGIVGLVTWFTIGLLLLAPVVAALARRAGQPTLPPLLTLAAFLSVMHGLTPPHPGAVAAADALGASPGVVLGLALFAGLPAALVAGPLYARWIAPRVGEPTPVAAPAPETGSRPALGAVAAVVALPIGLMLAASAAELAFPAVSAARGLLAVAGHPLVALAAAVLFGLRFLAQESGRSRREQLGLTEESVAAIGMTLLVVGAGGGFARVLREAGVARELAGLGADLALPPLVLGWLVAAFIRVATGSATVAATTAAGLVAPLLAANPGVPPALMVLAVGFGSLVVSHLNDGGFWIVKDALGLSVGQTLRTWTALETILGVAGLGATLLLSLCL